MSNTAITWRDLASDLTSDQIARMVGIEQQLGSATSGARLLRTTPDGVAALLVDEARELIEQNRSPLVAVTVPGGASAGQWQPLRIGGWVRELSWRLWQADPVEVAVSGEQLQDGTVNRGVAVHVPEGVLLTAEQARQAAAALVAAADQLQGQL